MCLEVLSPNGIEEIRRFRTPTLDFGLLLLRGAPLPGLFWA